MIWAPLRRRRRQICVKERWRGEAGVGGGGREVALVTAGRGTSADSDGWGTFMALTEFPVSLDRDVCGLGVSSRISEHSDALTGDSSRSWMRWSSPRPNCAGKDRAVGPGPSLIVFIARSVVEAVDKTLQVWERDNVHFKSLIDIFSAATRNFGNILVFIRCRALSGPTRSAEAFFSDERRSLHSWRRFRIRTSRQSKATTCWPFCLFKGPRISSDWLVWIMVSHRVGQGPGRSRVCSLRDRARGSPIVASRPTTEKLSRGSSGMGINLQVQQGCSISWPWSVSLHGISP